MIVETQKHGECTCHFDDSAYIQKTQEEVDSVLCMFSAFKDTLIGTAIVWLPIMLSVISGGLMQALGL